jgi:hypothetical protein
VEHEPIRIVAPAGPERTGDRRRDAAAHRARRQHLHHHEAGKHQRHPGQRVDAEARHPPGLNQACGSLRQHHQDVGPGETKQCPRDRRVEEEPGARIERTALRPRDVKRGKALDRSV